MFDMRRREFLSGLGANAALWPISSKAQILQKRPLIGLLTPGSKTTSGRFYDGFLRGMRERGYLERRDYDLEERYADGNLARLPALAEELVHLRPDVIVAGTSIAVLAVTKIASSIPIVGNGMTDPVGMGLAKSEAHPGGNVTGTVISLSGLAGKQLETGLDFVSKAKKVGVLVNPENPANRIHRRELQSDAAKLGVDLEIVEVRFAAEIGAAFQTLVRERAHIVLVAPDAMFVAARRQIAAIALVAGLPTVFYAREHVEVGGLVSYGSDLTAIYHRAAYYVDRILKGEKPADLPIEFLPKPELVINLATAKALGLEVPPTLLARADEVIE
jgi:putative tryptophan/tyrosine transport system substrate-binding protein